MKRVIVFVLSAFALAGCSVPTGPSPDTSAEQAARAKAALEGATASTPGISKKLATN